MVWRFWDPKPAIVGWGAGGTVSFDPVGWGAGGTVSFDPVGWGAKGTPTYYIFICLQNRINTYAIST